MERLIVCGEGTKTELAEPTTPVTLHGRLRRLVEPEVGELETAGLVRKVSTTVLGSMRTLVWAREAGFASSAGTS